MKIIGIITTFFIGIILLYKLYRVFFPKKYNWDNCTNDHDTMSRCGVERCDKCGNEL